MKYLSNRFASGRIELVQLVLAFAAIYLIWGSTYLGIRYAIETMPPFLMIAVRFLIGGLAFYGWARYRRRPVPTWRDWRSAWVIGSFMICGGTGLVAWAELTVPSGLTALLVGSMPLWIVVLDWMFTGGRRPSMLTSAGILLGIGGVALLVVPSELAEFAVDPIGAGAVVLAALLWAYGSLLSRRNSSPKSATMSLGMNMIGGSLSLLVVSLLVGEWQELSLNAVSAKSWLALAYLTIVGGIAFAAYIWLLRHTTPAKASTYAFVNPAVAMFLGVTLGGEPFDVRSLLAAGVIISAVAIIVLQTRKTRKVGQSTAPTGQSPEHTPCAVDGSL